MANVTALTVHSAVRNASAAITADLVTNGTVALTLAADLASAGGQVDRVILRVENDNTVATQTLSVSVLGSTTLPSHYGTVAAATAAYLATAGVAVLGPFDPARFDNNGTLQVTFTPATSGTLKFNASLVLLPKF